jgi:Pyruvate/2-oxoacid:ferredoxin oxidoreductase delta subunit
MKNRQLTQKEIETIFTPLMAGLREHLIKLSQGDPELLWALRRKLIKELDRDERGKTDDRRKLKDLKREAQKNKCAECSRDLPEAAVLDRFDETKDYTPQNTRVICSGCNVRLRKKHGLN